MTNNAEIAHEPKVSGTADRSGVAAFEYVFPAIRGIQAGREFFASMCPLRLIAKVFLFDEDELVPELRAQRVLNKGRLPEMCRYIVENPSSYVFSALTASIDGEVQFEPSTNEEHGSRIGLLRIPMDARFVINDGQHRRAAIELALREKPELGDEAISIVFFMDTGLKRSQQMFADLNRHAIRPSPSIGILYDHRDEDAAIVREMVLTSTVFGDLVELENASLGTRSRKLFTLSGLYTGTRHLLRGNCSERVEAVAIGREFWEGCADAIPDWKAVRDRRTTAGDLRREFIHSHGIALQALGMAGRQLLCSPEVEIKSELAKLRDLDWSRQNTEQWEGRAMVGGRISRSSSNVILTANVIMQRLGVTLPAEHEEIENAYLQGAI